ncbi:hypothetical protein JYT72_02775 [Crocinitomix catalasitica]|nr:hypothetical protein [Crocinitomix catalasitica]
MLLPTYNRSLLISLCFVSLLSCDNLEYLNAPPVSVRASTEIPENIQGTYYPDIAGFIQDSQDSSHTPDSAFFRFYGPVLKVNKEEFIFYDQKYWILNSDTVSSEGEKYSLHKGDVYKGGKKQNVRAYQNIDTGFVFCSRYDTIAFHINSDTIRLKITENYLTLSYRPRGVDTWISTFFEFDEFGIRNACIAGLGNNQDKQDLLREICEVQENQRYGRSTFIINPGKSQLDRLFKEIYEPFYFFKRGNL